jgi:hypothetical protein
MSLPKSRTAPSYNSQRNYLPDLPDQLRLYDEAIQAWLCQMTFDYGDREGGPDIQPLRVIKSSPERAFADYTRDTNYADDLGEYEIAQDQIPLPIASFTRTDLTVDMNRFKSVTNKYAGHLRQSKDEIYQWRFPLPYSLTYQVDFWTRYESTLDAIRIWTALKFTGGNHFYLPVDFQEIDRLYKIQNVFTQFGGISDTSDLEPGSEQRVERATMSLDIQGWIFFPVEIVKTVLCGQIDVLTVPDDVPLQDADDPAKINADACADEFVADEIPFSV